MPARPAGRRHVNHPAKLGSDRSVTGLLPALLTLVSIAFVWALFGREAAFAWAFLAFCHYTNPQSIIQFYQQL